MLLLLILFMALMLGVALFFKQPVVKGKCGEFLVALCLKFGLDNKTYRILNNVMLPDADGGTTQIDHVVFSQYGIFVVETKNMKGWIFGKRNEECWCQQIFRSKHWFQNPFRQNYKHLLCLAQVTGLPTEYFHHVIVFVGGAEIKTRDTLPESLITGGKSMLQYIKRHTELYFPEEMLQTLLGAVSAARIANTRTNVKKHVEYVRAIQEEKSRR